MIGHAIRSSSKRQLSYSIENEVRLYKFRHGISRSEVEKRLSSVGAYSISGGPRYYYVSFQGTMTYISVGKMRLFFDDDKPVGAARNTSLSDWSQVEDCQNSK
jgi:hypothetical protein